MQAHTEHVFAGVDRRADGDLPRPYASSTTAHPDGSFQEVLQDLAESFDIVTRPTGYFDKQSKTWVKDGRYLALVNPAWEGDGRDDAPQATALWHIATDSYSSANALDAYGPLVAVARKLDHPDTFGTIRTYRNGGEFAADIFFEDITADDPDTDDTRWVLGFESSADYYGRSSLKGQVIAFDTDTHTVMRGLSDTYSTPHRGDATERLADWFEGMFDRIERVGDTLYGVVAEARETTVRLDKTPLSVEEWYESLGFPGTLATAAAQRVPGQRPTAWELYMPMAQAITDTYDGKVSGQTLLDHATKVNNILFAPKSTEQTALENARDDLRGQATLTAEQEQATDILDERIESLDEAVETFTTARDRIRAIIDQMEDPGATA